MLREVYDSVSVITDECIWGEYAFSRDLLKSRVEIREKQDMIQEAAGCGRMLAEQLMTELHGYSISEMADDYNIRLMTGNESVIGERILLAQYTPPNEIVIMEEPLKKYEAALKRDHLEGILPPVSQVYNLLLGHELFHVLEDKYEDTIYTKSKKIILWKLWKYENKSTVRALSEIAAMYFSQTLNQAAFSPFILDILLSLQYSENIAGSIFEDIMKLVK